MSNSRRSCARRSARIDLPGTVAAGKDETEVAGAFGKREQPLIDLRGNPDVLDARHRARRVEADDTAKDAAARDRNHHHARRAILADPRRRVFAEGMPQQQFLERDAGARRLVAPNEPESPRAQPADRPGRDFEHVDAARVHAALGVNRAVIEPERRRGLR